MKGVVRRCEDDAVGKRHLFDKRVPIILQWTEFLPLFEAEFAPSAGFQFVVSDRDDLAVDVSKRLQQFRKTLHSAPGMFFAVRPEESCYFLHTSHLPAFGVDRTLDGRAPAWFQSTPPRGGRQYCHFFLSYQGDKVQFSRTYQYCSVVDHLFI